MPLTTISSGYGYFYKPDMTGMFKVYGHNFCSTTAPPSVIQMNLNHNQDELFTYLTEKKLLSPSPTC